MNIVLVSLEIISLHHIYIIFERYLPDVENFSDKIFHKIGALLGDRIKVSILGCVTPRLVRIPRSGLNH